MRDKSQRGKPNPQAKAAIRDTSGEEPVTSTMNLPSVPVRQLKR